MPDNHDLCDPPDLIEPEQNETLEIRECDDFPFLPSATIYGIGMSYCEEEGWQIDTIQDVILGEGEHCLVQDQIHALFSLRHTADEERKNNDGDSVRTLLESHLEAKCREMWLEKKAK